MLHWVGGALRVGLCCDICVGLLWYCEYSCFLFGLVVVVDARYLWFVDCLRFVSFGVVVVVGCATVLVLVLVGMLLWVWIVVIAEFSFGCLCGLVLVCGAGVSDSVFAVVYEYLLRVACYYYSY